MKSTSPIALIVAWFLFVVSFTFPPALLLSGPWLFILVRRTIRRARWLRRSEAAFITEAQVQLIGKLFASKR